MSSKIRLIIFLSTIIIVGFFATLISFYARGYRINSENMQLNPNGLLVIKSNPDGAQIYVNGELKTATDATIPLAPNTYDISIKKEGYIEWKKRLAIQKEIVTEATAHLFKSAPSLSAITFSSVVNPTPSRDFTKLAYIVPATGSNSDTAGLWVMEILNLPLGFARDPKRITDGDLIPAQTQLKDKNFVPTSFIWSHDGSQILLSTQSGAYILDSSKFTPQAQRVNNQALKDTTLEKWEIERNKVIQAQIRKAPLELQDILIRKSSSVTFSPDEDMILYTASSEGKLDNNLIKQLPGASTQKQDRDIKPDNTYVYDIKEDRNFLIDDHSKDLQIKGGYSDGFERRLMWYPSSRNLVLAEPNQIAIMDYDGTNRQVVYSGSYVAPNAFPTLSFDRLLILTNLGAAITPPNLYSLTVK